MTTFREQIATQSTVSVVERETKAADTVLFVINSEDSTGKEYYLAASGKFVALADPGQEEPQLLKLHTQIAAVVEQLRVHSPATCRFYVLEINEFKARQRLLQSPQP